MILVELGLSCCLVFVVWILFWGICVLDFVELVVVLVFLIVVWVLVVYEDGYYMFGIFEVQFGWYMYF